MTIWRMRIACWMPKATNTHPEYVILFPFPRQKWLRERSSTLLGNIGILNELSDCRGRPEVQLNLPVLAVGPVDSCCQLYEASNSKWTLTKYYKAACTSSRCDTATKLALVFPVCTEGKQLRAKRHAKYRTPLCPNHSTEQNIYFKK